MFMKKMKKSILRNIFESRNYILTRLVHFVQQKIKLEIQINLHVYGVNKLTLHTRCGIHLQLSAIYALMFNCVPAFSRVIGQFNLQHLLPIKYLMQLVSRRFVIYTFSLFMRYMYGDIFQMLPSIFQIRVVRYCVCCMLRVCSKCVDVFLFSGKFRFVLFNVFFSGVVCMYVLRSIATDSISLNEISKLGCISLLCKIISRVFKVRPRKTRKILLYSRKCTKVKWQTLKKYRQLSSNFKYSYLKNNFYIQPVLNDFQDVLLFIRTCHRLC